PTALEIIRKRKVMLPTEFRTGVIRPIECVKHGFALIKEDFWLLFAVWLVGALIGGLTLYVMMGAMICGIYYVYLKKIDGFPVAFEDLWKGMEWFVPGLVVVAAIIVPMFIIYGFIYFPFLAIAISGERMSQDELVSLIFGVLAIDFVLIVFMVGFHTLLVFAIPLVVDRNLGAIAAMKTSARAALANLGGVTGLVGVNFVSPVISHYASAFILSCR
ncbi:MAG: hypothetical protein LC730_02725, partial [Acidobacteria bacterium]|nr:hypothetical protein [Acidobacteriota bacterium]MCA1608358.1 hypothetical protein [Acidobacteriota bacterium]